MTTSRKRRDSDNRSDAKYKRLGGAHKARFFLIDGTLERVGHHYGHGVPNPILGLGRSGGGSMSLRMASKTTLNWASYLDSSSSSRRARSACVIAIWRRRTNVRMISMLTLIARGLRKTLESMATPRSVKA